MATHPASSSAALYRNAGMGRRLGLTYFFRLAIRERRSTEITAAEDYCVHDREQ